jgi:hypothetical protein
MIATRVHGTTARIVPAATGIAVTTRIAPTTAGIHTVTTTTINIDVITSATTGTIWTNTSCTASYTRRRTMHVVTTKTPVPDRTTLGIEAGMMIGMAVSTIIRYPYAWTTIVEIAASVIAINGEVPAASTPYYRTKEVVGSH